MGPGRSCQMPGRRVGPGSLADLRRSPPPSEPPCLSYITGGWSEPSPGALFLGLRASLPKRKTRGNKKTWVVSLVPSPRPTPQKCPVRRGFNINSGALTLPKTPEGAPDGYFYPFKTYTRSSPLRPHPRESVQWTFYTKTRAPGKGLMKQLWLWAAERPEQTSSRP